METWGTAETKYFFDLTPDRILDAVEEVGLECTGRVMALNSMENRVYEVEIEVDDPSTLRSPSERFRIVKFYRPGRWTEAQIQEEHDYLLDLVAHEIPVVAPLPFATGKTIEKVPDVGIYFSVFPKVGGRSPQELSDEQVTRIGRLLGRMHNVGSSKKAQHRIRIHPQSYGLASLEFLLASNSLPSDIRDRYVNVVRNICELTTPWFDDAEVIRLHGDCHLGNLLWNDVGPFWVDFDDMVRGPAIQDLWLVVPGRDAEARMQRSLLIEAYGQFRPFDHQSLRLLEPLRAMRFMHFSAWIAKRWQDPAFPRAFPNFGTERYWHEQVQDLEDQHRIITQGDIQQSEDEW